MADYHPYHPQPNDPQQSQDQQQPYYGQQQPDYNQQPYYGQQQPDYNQQPYYGQQQPDYNQQQPYYGQQQPDYNQQQPYYGQQQPYYNPQQPYYGQQPCAPAAATPLKKSGGKARLLTILGISLGAVLVLAAAAFFFGNTLLARFAPKAALSRGVSKSVSEIEERIDGSPYRALEIIGESLRSGSVTGDFSFTDHSVSNFGTVTFTSDYENKDFSLSADLDVNNVRLDGALFFNQERLALQSSILPDCYGVTFKTFEKDLRASAVPEYTHMSEDNMENLADMVKQIEDLSSADLSELSEAYDKLFEDYIDKLELESATEKTEVGGEEVSCSAVSTKLKDRDLRKLVMDAARLLLEDENVHAPMMASFIASGSGGYTEKDLEDRYRKECDRLLGNLEDELEALSTDMTVTWYLSDGKLVKAVLSGDVTANGNTARVNCTMDLGRNPAKDDWLLAVTASGADRDDFVAAAKIRYSGSTEGDSYHDKLSVTIDNGYSTQNVSLQTEWDKASGDLDLTLRDPGNTYRARCNLVVNDDACKLSMEDFGDLLPPGTTLNLSLSADQTGKVKSPSFVNLDRWDSNTLDQIGEAVSRYISPLS